VALANARLSERSARGYGRFARLTRPMLAEMSLIAAQTEVEAQRFLALGARAACVQVTGSIKFDLKIDEQLVPRAQALRQQWAATSRPVWIAASTHDGEDALILQAHQQLLQVHGDALLILVPRHPERFDAVHAICSQQFATVRRSTGLPVLAQTQVLLGDTMGELLFLYALADMAFVGGSLVPTGGHNPLEPAALALPVLMGPHVFNFLEISAMLREAGALQQVDDAQGLAGAVQRLVELPQDARRMGEAGRAVMRANQGALQRLLKGLGRLMP
jgi:3-deoxy-D-manno-octulosonic-acid transferase